MQPSNIFFTPSGTIKVGDFGLATTARTHVAAATESSSDHEQSATEAENGLFQRYEFDIHKKRPLRASYSVTVSTERGTAILSLSVRWKGRIRRFKERWLTTPGGFRKLLSLATLKQIVRLPQPKILVQPFVRARAKFIENP